MVEGPGRPSPSFAFWIAQIALVHMAVPAGARRLVLRLL